MRTRGLGRQLAGYILAATIVSSFVFYVSHDRDEKGKLAEAEFYSGKRLTYIVASKTGGGYDNYARLIARHLPKYLPVESVQVLNIPGTGGLKGYHHISSARADGLTIGTFNSGLLYTGRNIDPGLEELDWIGKASTVTSVFLVADKTGSLSIEDLQTREVPLFMAASGVYASSYFVGVLVARMLDIKVTPVSGYSGSGGALAMMRGDIDVIYGSYSSLQRLVEAGVGKMLFYVGDQPPPGADVPPLEALIQDQEFQEVVELLIAVNGLARLTAAPTGVPEDRLAILRSAYHKTLQDPDLLKEAVDRRLPVVAFDGVSVSRMVRDILARSDILDRALGEQGQVR